MPQSVNGQPRRLRQIRIVRRRMWRKLRNKTWLWISLTVTVFYVASGLWVYSGFTDWSERGQFGDMFGAVNALFSALAFSGVVYAILLQRQELTLQRRELQLTRAQIAEQTKIHSQRLEMSLAAQQPLLRFIGVFSRTGKGPAEAGVISVPEEGVLTLEVFNEGGPMYHSVGSVWYRDGPFSELFPCDQSEHADLTATPDAAEDAGNYVLARGKGYIQLHCRLYHGQDLAAAEITFGAALIIRYINSLNLPRVCQYFLRVKQEKGRLFLIRDMDPVVAMEMGLLDEFPGHSFRPYGEKKTVELHDLFPGVE